MSNEDIVRSLAALKGDDEPTRLARNAVIKAAGGWPWVLRMLQLAVAKEVARKKPDAAEPETFSAWYAAYPIHKGRDEAARQYAVAARRVSPEILLKAAQIYAIETSGREPSKIKHPATWLRQGCWQDERGLSLVFSAPEPVSIATWVSRLEMHAGIGGGKKGTWLEKWGPRENAPKEAIAEFERKHGGKRAQNS